MKASTPAEATISLIADNPFPPIFHAATALLKPIISKGACIKALVKLAIAALLESTPLSDNSLYCPPAIWLPIKAVLAATPTGVKASPI